MESSARYRFGIQVQQGGVADELVLLSGVSADGGERAGTGSGMEASSDTNMAGSRPDEAEKDCGLSGTTSKLTSPRALPV
jgi:hypothetical protein